MTGSEKDNFNHQANKRPENLSGPRSNVIDLERFRRDKYEKLSDLSGFADDLPHFPYV